ncbi:MAG: tetratricopeptide repeat protein [Planctomycetia bacterium]|nr:tetratricopeptide repeat protein [Planctomycetia bacterium]
MEIEQPSDEAAPNYFREMLSAPFRYLAYGIYAVCVGEPRIEEVTDWDERIRLDLVLPGLAAVVAGTLTLAVAVLTLGMPPTKFHAAYAAAADAALREKNYDVAVVCLGRLIDDSPEQPNHRYLLAIALAGRGETQRASELMQSIAPEDRLGFPAAHIWLIRRTLSQPKAPDPAALRNAERHLILLKTNPKFGAEAAAMLAELYLRTARAAMVTNDPVLLQAALNVPELQILVAKDQLSRGDGARAATLLKSLQTQLRMDLEKQPADDEARRRLVTALLLSGDHDAAFAVLREGLTLKPDGPFGSLAAQVATALAMHAVDNPALSSAERMRFVLSALELMQKYGETGVETDLAVARLLKSANRREEAIERYRSLGPRSTTARMELAAVLLSLGRKAEAEAEFKAVIQWYREHPDDPANEQLLPLHAAAAAVRLGRAPDAVGYLKQPHLNVPPELQRAALTEAYLAWDDLLTSATEKAQIDKRFKLLRSALREDRWHPEVLRRLLDLAQRFDGVAEMTRTFLQDLITAGDVPAPAYLLLGADALAHGDRPTARSYLEQAYRLNSELVPTLYQLALVLAEDEQDPDGPLRAVQLLNVAIQKESNDIPLRYLRGRTLAKLSRWQDALADLELCALRMSDNAEFHRTIAQVYTGLDLKDLARKHAELAKRGSAK